LPALLRLNNDLKLFRARQRQGAQVAKDVEPAVTDTAGKAGACLCSQRFKRVRMSNRLSVEGVVHQPHQLLEGRSIKFWKDGRTADAPVCVDAEGNQVRGLSRRGEVSTDVFECASVNAAAGLGNWAKSRSGARAGKAVGFPRFKSRHKTTRKAGRRLEGNQEPPPRRCVWSREAGES
jgi:hypothetical protein